MATVKGVNKTIADAPSGASVLNGGQLGGNVKVMQDSYEADSLASGSIIELFKKLPKYARVLRVIVYADALGSGVTLKAGDYKDDDRYFDAEVFHTADKVKEADEIDGVNYEVTEADSAALDSQFILTTGGAVANGTIKAQIFYSFE